MLPQIIRCSFHPTGAAFGKRAFTQVIRDKGGGKGGALTQQVQEEGETPGVGGHRERPCGDTREPSPEEPLGLELSSL